MKKTKYRKDGKNIICYQITNEEMLRTSGTIINIAKESEKLGAECNVHDEGEEGYRVELIMPQKSWNLFKKRNDNNNYNQFSSQLDNTQNNQLYR